MPDFWWGEKEVREHPFFQSLLCVSHSLAVCHIRVCIHLYSMIVGVRKREQDEDRKIVRGGDRQPQTKAEWLIGNDGWSCIVPAFIKAHRPPLHSINSWKAVKKNTNPEKLLINKDITPGLFSPHKQTNE